MYNNLIVGYSYSDESRGDVGQLFPFVDILNRRRGVHLIRFGAFTPNNELRYSSWQVQDNFTWDLGIGHVLTFGVAVRSTTRKRLLPGKQSAYVYNSLADSTRMRTPISTIRRTPITAAEFQVRLQQHSGTGQAAPAS